MAENSIREMVASLAPDQIHEFQVKLTESTLAIHGKDDKTRPDATDFYEYINKILNSTNAYNDKQKNEILRRVSDLISHKKAFRAQALMSDTRTYENFHGNFEDIQQLAIILQDKQKLKKGEAVKIGNEKYYLIRRKDNIVTFRDKDDKRLAIDIENKKVYEEIKNNNTKTTNLNNYLNNNPFQILSPKARTKNISNH